MEKRSFAFATLLSAAAIAFSATVVQSADDTAYQLVWAGVTLHPAPSVTHGDGQTSTAANWVVELFNTEASGFMNAAVGNCNAWYEIDGKAGTIDMRGYCRFHDADGDEAWDTFSTGGVTAIATYRQGIQVTWLGGTGKYQGLTGDAILVSYGILPGDGYEQLGGTMNGHYRIN